MASGTIKNIDDIQAEITSTIKIGGIPTVINATEHKALQENETVSLKTRLQKSVVNNLSSTTVDFRAAESGGIHLFTLVDNTYKIEAFSNAVKGDEIWLIIIGNFLFDFGATFKTNNLIYGEYIQKASGFNLIKVTCLNNDVLGTQFLVEYKNESANFGYTKKTLASVVTYPNVRRTYRDIGDWNMDTTPFVDVTHGVSDFLKIRNVSVLIREDGNVMVYPLDYAVVGVFTVQGTFNIQPTVFRLGRLGGGFFDDPAFNQTSFNRGFITFDEELS